MPENFISQKLGRFEAGYLPDSESKLFFEGERRTKQVTNFTVLLLLATVIATYGVITDATATAIGAMLIAPLMTPIMATAAAVIFGSPARAFKSLQLVVLGVAAVNFSRRSCHSLSRICSVSDPRYPPDPFPGLAEPP